MQVEVSSIWEMSRSISSFSPAFGREDVLLDVGFYDLRFQNSKINESQLNRVNLFGRKV